MGLFRNLQKRRFRSYTLFRLNIKVKFFRREDGKTLFRRNAVPYFLILILLLVFSTQSEGAWEKGIIGSGEIYQTPYYVQDSNQEGYTLMLVGGVHGNEPAGAYALLELLEELTIDQGKLIVIPKANKQALEMNLRYPPGASDLNRAFTDKTPETWTEHLAAEIFDLVIAYEVDLLFDLHEARDYHRINPSSVGQTLLFNTTDEHVLLPWDIADIINPLLFPLERFILMSPTARDSLTRKVYQDLTITTMITETTLKQPMEVRITQQKMIVLSALYLLEMLDELDLPDINEVK